MKSIYTLNFKGKKREAVLISQ